MLAPMEAVAAGKTKGTADREVTVAMGPAQPFSFEILKTEARKLAGKAYVPGRSPHSEILDKIDYDAYQQIRYKSAATLPIGGTPVQLFHLGRYFQDPVRMHVVSGGTAREVLYDTSLFDMPEEHPARAITGNAGFSGFRIMSPSLVNDWYAALGASYFRTSGPYNQYGLSARGLAIDTGLPTPEEFPRFASYWLEAADDGSQALTIFGLLDSPSVTGAYRIATKRMADERDVYRITQDVALELYARKDIERLGIAPFSSMFWYGEGSRKQAADWRPEVHDSDGLAIHTGTGERLWRPLNNPPRVITNSFVDKDIKGFGLQQRDRDFVSYLDDGVFYERRASVWVEPGEGWGEGAVQLLEIPTDDEIHDNIAVYWNPARSLKAGESGAWSYRLTWLDDVPLENGLGRATASFSGMGGRPGIKRPEGVRKFVVDFQGEAFKGLGREDGVKLIVTASRGEVSNAYTHPVVDQRERWRALFDIAASGTEPVDIRAYLSHGGKALSETWLGQYFP
ncbi:MAG: glucan biosynthesis protein [Hyphomicrobiaceae bacterium]|nr:glucan biosynthesis protein [Hyphomicrobiaceae bacterium]